MKNIALYGGTFDPIHLGHIAVAISLIEQKGLDHVFFIPAKNNPFKQKAPHASAEHRYAMVETALKGVPHCSALPLEIHRTGPSFTIDTVQQLRSEKLQREDALFFIIGEDQLRHFHEWKEVEELVLLAQPLVVKRPGSHLEGEWKKNPLLARVIEKGTCTTPLFDISATQIRDRLKKKLFCGHLLHPSVLQYIEQHALYE